ncbi:bifunctional diguanylate cyclase/phosphodiesterase [Cupriavidus consociatus]|uniref:bifunctional diguanylate cyclase/phosphodiesterase n=1 Tax=Cupriavidus consociatus TaxID=2821357 RepID=UPI001FD7D329|nr:MULTISPECIES: EAL domain-containing protein [unclassified Cupriavidus]MDK2655862.1 EAL domain-containing protein [Cupriavidus sp. LEh21]
MRQTLARMRGPLGRLGSRTITAGTVLLGALTTAVVYAFCTDLLERDVRLRFENDTGDVVQQFDTRIRLYTDVLVTMQALFGASDHVTRSEFRDFVSGLNLAQRYPGFQTLNYAPYVPASEIDAFVARQRIDPILREAGVTFSVRPPGKRPGHFVLTYVEPLDLNLASIGIDMGAEPRRLAALERARDTGQSVSSGRLIFSEATNPHVGIALRLPVYRKVPNLDSVEARRHAYVGSVGAGIRVDGLLKDLVSNDNLRRIRFRVYDAGDFAEPAASLSAGNLLYDSLTGLAKRGRTRTADDRARPGAAADGPAEPDASQQDLTKSVVRNFGGRRWVIDFAADSNAISGPQRYLPMLVVASGLIISVLLGWLAYALSSSRARAVATAEEMTHSLRESQAALAEAQQIAHLGDWRIDLGANIAYFSREMARLLGWRGPKPTPEALFQAVEDSHRAVLREKMEAALRDRQPFEFECPYRSQRGRRGWLHLIGHAHGAGVNSTVLRGTAQDISQRKSAERARAQEHQITLHLATATSEAEVLEEIVHTLLEDMDWEAGAFWPADDSHGPKLPQVCQSRVKALEPWLAARPALPAGAAALQAPQWYAGHLGMSRHALAGWLATGGLRTVFAFPLSRGHVTLGVVELYSRVKRSPDAHALAMAGGIASQTGHFLLRRQAEENLRFIANHDALTGLPNRLMFKAEFEKALTRARADGQALHVIFVDLDEFKVVNDTIGHNAGDTVLREMADRLRVGLPDVELITRFGGDEFVVLLDPKGDSMILGQTLARIQAVLAPGFVVNDSEMRMTASIGISSFPEDGNDWQTLLKHADLAMYGAKQLGKNGYQFYTRGMSTSLQRRIDMESHLHRALEQDEFVLYYQPRIALASGACTAVEALIRWRHPELGLVMPGDFIPFAEQSGAIVEIGAWALREACRQNAAWRAQGLPPVRVSVNLSARQFADKSLRLTIIDALRQAGLPGNLLELELTESMIMRDAEQASNWLSRLKRTGVRLAIDDFGTGYSSLAYLSRFPIDTVKIDRSFVRYVPESRSDTQITSAVIGLGHRLGLEVVAEGVETEAQLEFLRREGCDEVQGYYFSHPLPLAKVTAFLASRMENGPAFERDQQPMRA